MERARIERATSGLQVLSGAGQAWSRRVDVRRLRDFELSHASRGTAMVSLIRRESDRHRRSSESTLAQVRELLHELPDGLGALALARAPGDQSNHDEAGCDEHSQ